MDAHVSVIADFKSANPEIEVDDWCISGHAWVLNRKMDNPDFVNNYSFHQINEDMIQKFQERYDSFLQQFDGFITCHVPAFAMIYEKYNKPVLMINSCRYDLPFCQTKDYYMLQKFHQCIHRIKDRITIVSNNLADQLYTFKGIGIQPLYNPSLCLYTNVKYNPVKPTFLCYNQINISHELITNKSELSRPYKWNDLMMYRGIIHVPYEISTMSMFEQFTAGCPLFFPSKSFLKSNSHFLISMQSYWGNECPKYLNEFLNLDRWIDLSDMYNAFKSPNTYYYDSAEHLFDLLKNFVYIDDTEYRQIYIQKTKDTWKTILLNLFKTSNHS
jgi:hypothetical protein